MATELGISNANNVRVNAGTQTRDPVNPVSERWVYGFWFKNKHMKLIAKKLGLDWDKRAFTATYKVHNYVWKTARVYCTIRGVQYRDQRGLIMTFLEGDEHRSLDNLEFSEKQMDRVRKAMGLPKGTKPRWYDVYGEKYDPDYDKESDDEEHPLKGKPRQVSKRIYEIVDDRDLDCDDGMDFFD
ncbi:hypothetical protein A7U60_g521 [Sanghuangporus baumii]|uniref:Uncharacterized protein n=1 Tax=Sanghuangporus baumii TaxID=108892 RepID=A0A9Q5I5L5_SANBA|nr:hypothetical protein A7U60_g521 [Sanghuangporus baumii]